MSLRQILWSVLANCNAESQCQRLVVAAYIKSHWETTNDLMKQCPEATPFVIWVAGTRDIGRNWEKGLGRECKSNGLRCLLGNGIDLITVAFFPWTDVLLLLFWGKWMTQNYLTTWERPLPLDNEQQPFARNDEMRVGRSLWLTLNLLRIFFFSYKGKGWSLRGIWVLWEA